MAVKIRRSLKSKTRVPDKITDEDRKAMIGDLGKILSEFVRVVIIRKKA